MWVLPRYFAPFLGGCHNTIKTLKTEDIIMTTTTAVAALAIFTLAQNIRTLEASFLSSRIGLLSPPLWNVNREKSDIHIQATCIKRSSTSSSKRKRIASTSLASTKPGKARKNPNKSNRRERASQEDINDLVRGECTFPSSV